MAKRKDVAWGFFYTFDGRQLFATTTRAAAADSLWYYRHFAPGPIFRIVPPKPKRRGK